MTVSFLWKRKTGNRLTTIAVAMTTLAVLAMATGGVGLVVAVAALGAAGGMALGGTLAAENYYAANGTMTGAGDSVMNGMANGAMLGSIAGLLAGVGLSALAASGTGAGAQIAMNASMGGSGVNIDAESLKYSKSAVHADRAYQKSTQTIQEIINSGIPKADPRGSQGLWWNVKGLHNKTSGHYELLISPDKTTIWHYLFKAD